MLRDECVDVVPTWAQEADKSVGHREIDRELRRIAKKRAGLDVEEARWLREAEKQRVWRKLGFSTALEYLEDVFGYAPRTAMERLRVARELAELPALEAELGSGALPWSAAKELSRVMTPRTEAAWLARARGKNLRDIEELVAGHKKGDDPDAPKDPALMTRRWVVELPPRVDALLQQCRVAAANEQGSHVDDADLIELLCRDFLAGSSAPAGTPSRPVHRIVIHKCDECGRGWQDAPGRRVPLDEHELACVECDAETVDERHVADGGTDGAVDPAARGSQAAGRVRVTSALPARTHRLVWRRDRGRCRVPGCRATRNLDIHHIIPRAEGGDHDPSRLLVLCSGHHKLHHSGVLVIRGRAQDHLVFVRDGKPLVDARSPVEQRAARNLREQERVGEAGERARPRDKRRTFGDVVTLQTAKRALMDLGYKPRAATKALEQVSAHVDAGADVATLVQAVLARGSAAADTVADGEDDTLTLAKQAVIQLGYTAAVANAAIHRARAHVDAEADLPTVIKAVLRFCS
jgi:Holliday junction resolvasome RuvABC DNA-binding subunit